MIETELACTSLPFFFFAILVYAHAFRVNYSTHSFGANSNSVKIFCVRFPNIQHVCAIWQIMIRTLILFRV